MQEMLDPYSTDVVSIQVFSRALVSFGNVDHFPTQVNYSASFLEVAQFTPSDEKTI